MRTNRIVWRNLIASHETCQVKTCGERRTLTVGACLPQLARVAAQTTALPAPDGALFESLATPRTSHIEISSRRRILLLLVIDSANIRAGSISMHRATPIRERNGASQPKCFGFCTCTPFVGRESATPVVSADTKSPRICTFRSYLNFIPFNRYAASPPISFSFCRCNNTGRGLLAAATRGEEGRYSSHEPSM